MYKIQIIIPVFNAENTLQKCLDSIKNQSFADWQAILVNDASVDDSLNIMEKYAQEDSRFVCINRTENGGASEAKNMALKLVDAEYVAFLDSDDYWESDMLRTLYERAKEFDADVVQCRFIYDFPDGSTILPAGAFKRDIVLCGKGLKKVYLKMMTGINMNHVCMKLIKSSVVEGLVFDAELPTAEDLDFSVRMFRNVKRYSFVTNVFYHYCRWENSITGRGLPIMKRLNANRKVARVMAESLEGWGIDNLFYKTLTYLRPYVIIVSKVFRIAREKIFKNQKRG